MTADPHRDAVAAAAASDTAYLVCLRCGAMLPIMHTDEHEPCPNACAEPLVIRDDATACPRCGQTGTADVCGACRKLEREAQGESVRLFEPAPTQLPGQLAL